LAERLRGIVELRSLLETVRDRVSEALHVNVFEIYIRKNEELQPALATDALAWSDPASVLALESKRSSLSTKSGHLLIPLLGRTELLGFFRLGPRLSEAPYSTSEVELLQSVASQTSFAIENISLTEKIVAETAEREVMRRELAIARDVQQRLFPQEQPAIPGMVYSAACRPAREVGGDYYDYFRLDGNVFGIGIGDVSGKGIPASLLMASLQASLRGQTMREAVPINCLMENVNRLIWTTSPENKYATFFYAQYDPDRRSLTYSNAGHNAPFWIRRNGEIVRLNAGGAPVGLFEEAKYTCERIDMSVGDLLVLYTDGVSEAMNSKDEEWGEDRMAELLLTLANREPKQILFEIFSGADVFAAGAPQHDDMTAMVFLLTPFGSNVAQ
jgi:sigma-B regulation protein RsbU (phosphoserine phosphatase)